jgi:hypothetical protein
MRHFLLGFILTAMTTSASARPDLKITTVRRFSLGPSDQVQTDFIQADRMRSERSLEYRQALWPGGPSALFRGPRLVHITRCDLGQIFTLNLDDSKYASQPYPRVPTSAEQEAYAIRRPQVENRKPTVRVEISTNDTGERKEMFGFAARHIITTSTEIPLENTTASRGFTEGKEYVTDGWYIDLDTTISCMRKAAPGTFAYGFLTLSSGTQQPDVPTLKLNGKPETGFAVKTKMTSRSTLTVADGSRHETISVNETEVTSLSTASLDPMLFELPAKFELAAQMNLASSPPLWARWLMQAHSYWIKRPRN